MGQIITDHMDKVFVECGCGCSIISFSDIIDDEVYLSFYGRCKDRAPDFIFESREKFQEFIGILKIAISQVAENYWTEDSPFDDKDIGIIEGRKIDKECLCVAVDKIGTVTILKYHKNYKKFKKLYNLDDCVEYKKCKCDWDICISADEAKELVSTLENLVDCNTLENS